MSFDLRGESANSIPRDEGVKRASVEAKGRKTLLDQVWQEGRAYSDALVLFHLEVARRLELNPTDYKTMSVLGRLGPMSGAAIAKYTGLTPASVTDLVDRLERKGFVLRERDPTDRRRTMITPIAERVAEIRQLFIASSGDLRRIHDSYSDAELEVILNYLSRNAERLRNETLRLQR